MPPILEQSNKLINKANLYNTHLLFSACLAFVFIINIFLNYKEPFHVWVEIIGSIIQIAIPMYAIVPVLWKKDGAGAVQMLKILAIILGVTWAFKLGLGQIFEINETRPRGGSMSFPSGHTAGAFSGAIFLSIRYGWKYALISVPLAIFVAYTRIYSFAHWPLDVYASIILSIVAGALVVRPNKKEKAK